MIFIRITVFASNWLVNFVFKVGVEDVYLLSQQQFTITVTT